MGKGESQILLSCNLDPRFLTLGLSYTPLRWLFVSIPRGIKTYTHSVWVEVVSVSEDHEFKVEGILFLYKH